MIIGHLLLSILLTWTRVTAMGLDVVRATLCQIFLSMMVVFGTGYLPALGQYRFWTQNYGSTIKSGLVVLLAMFVNSSFAYVRSSHETVRRTLGSCFLCLGELLTKVSSELGCLAGSPHTPKGVRLKEAPTSVSITRMTIDSQMSLLLSTMEPGIPFLSSKSNDIRAFGILVSKLQVHLGSVRSIEKITQTLIDGINVPDPVQVQLLTWGAIILSTLAGVANEMSGALCCENSSWRPHSLEFWDAAMAKIGECLEDAKAHMQMSASNGIKRALEEELDSISDVRGTGVAFLASLESVVDELIGLEAMLCRALELEETELCGLLPKQEVVRPWYRYRWIGAIVNDFKLASGIHIWKMHWNSAQGVLSYIQRHVFSRKPKGGSECVEIVAASQSRRKLQLFWKVYVSYQLSVVAVVLITWLRFGRKGNFKASAEGSAEWVTNWYPEYFFLAVAICSQDTVDSSMYKAILRVTLIALGGGLAIGVAAAEITSPWFTFWITMLVTFVTALPAVISFDFRYSLFLFSYTFNGIFVCSYRKPFSAALQLYAGKSVSTALGALFAAIVSNVVFPSYVSQVAFEHEAGLLSSYTSALAKSFGKGRAWPHASEQGELWDPRYPRIGYKSADHEELSRDLLGATRARLGIIHNLYKTVETASLDRHFMFFLEVTLLPMPPALKLIFADISQLGMFATMSARVLRSSFLRGTGGDYSRALSSSLFDQTALMIAAAQDVSEAVRTILVRKTIEEEDIENLKAKVMILQSERGTLSAMFNRMPTGPDLVKADVRTTAWYTMVLRGCKEMAALGKRLSERPDFQSKQIKWTFQIRIPQKDSLSWWG